jgi:Holliday junction resolvasome RuvABC ATP-dependent DNA helicase subunit
VKLPEKNNPPQKHSEPVDYKNVPLADLPGLEQICGQAEAISQLKAFADWYKGKGETPEHILLTGADGMGKRTIARAFAKT